MPNARLLHREYSIGACVVDNSGAEGNMDRPGAS